MLVTVNGVGMFEGTLPSAPDSDNLFTVQLMGLTAGSNLSVALRSINIASNYPNGFFVDSVSKDTYGCALLKETVYITGTVLSQLLLMPMLEDLPEYQGLDTITQFIVGHVCYDTRLSVPTLSDTDIALCEEFTILASSGLFNGTLGRLVIVEM